MRSRSLFAALIAGSAGLSVGPEKERLLDALSGGYDRARSAGPETSNSTSPVPNPDEIFWKRDGCNNGVTQCDGFYCDHCGSCCDGGNCAENFGNCCGGGIQCSFGFSCCTGSSSCCYAETSFCCPTSDSGCCVKGTQCTSDGCVGTPDFVLGTQTVTTVYTETIYNTSTVTSAFTSTRLGTTTNFVTQTVTSSDVDIATVTSYVTSTNVVKRTIINYPTETPVASATRHKPPTAPAPPPSGGAGLNAVRDGLGGLRLLPKREETSYVVVYDFVWETTSQDLFITSSDVSTVDSMRTEESTIVSTVFKDAKSTTTVTSTIVVTETGDTTSDTNNAASADSTVTTTENSQFFITSQASLPSDTGVFVTATDNDGGSGSQTVLSQGDTTATSPSTSPTNSNNGSGSGGAKESQANLSTGAKAGIGAGAAAAGLAAIGGVVLLIARRRRPRPRSFESPTPSQLLITSGNGSSWAPPRPPARQRPFTAGQEITFPERAAGLASAMAAGGLGRTPVRYSGTGSSMRSPISGGASQRNPPELMPGHVSPPSRNSRSMAGSMSSRKGNGAYGTNRPRRGTGANSSVASQCHEMPSQLYYELPVPPADSYPSYRPT